MDKYNFDFVIGITPGLPDIRSCLNTLESSRFRMIEIPGTWLESPDKSVDEVISQFYISGATDLIAPSVSSSISEQKENIINGFIEKLKIMFEQLEKYNIKQFSLNIGMENIFSNPSHISSRISLLKRVAPYLYRKKLKLCIPVRLPSATSVPKGKYGTLLKDTLSNDIRIALNVHPHETATHKKPFDLINEFRFFIQTFSFVYEPETGNILVEKLIEPWLKALQDINYKGPVIFRPRLSTAEKLRTSVKFLSALLNLN